MNKEKGKIGGKRVYIKQFGYKFLFESKIII